MRIAIMSDSHDRWDNLKKAVVMANDRGCELLLFAGDLIAPPGLPVLEQFAGQVKFVWGNNEAERVGMTRKMDASPKIELCDDVYEATVDQVRIFMNHYPRFSQLAAKSGEFDLCIYGHTHRYNQQAIGTSLLVNPGEIQGHLTGTSTFVIFETTNKSVEKVVIVYENYDYCPKFGL